MSCLTSGITGFGVSGQLILSGTNCLESLALSLEADTDPVVILEIPKHCPERYSLFVKGRSSSISLVETENVLPSWRGHSAFPVAILLAN